MHVRRQNNWDCRGRTPKSSHSAPAGRMSALPGGLNGWETRQRIREYDSAHIAAGRVDNVVVYKVDRLTTC